MGKQSSKLAVDESPQPSLYITPAIRYISPDIRYRHTAVNHPVAGPNNHREDTAQDHCSRLRNRCYLRLKLMNLLQTSATQLRKNYSLLVFEWDNCLLCTSYLKNLGEKAFEESVLTELQQLDVAAVLFTQSEVLSLALSLGQVHLVTRSSLTFISRSASRWLPSTTSLLSFTQIHSQVPSKREALLAIASPFLLNVILVSVDEEDYQAGTSLKLVHPNLYLKYVRMSPGTPASQSLQLREIAAHLRHIYDKSCDSAFTLQDKK